MGLILNIETSGKNCSVALADKENILLIKEVHSDKFVHAEQLHWLIDSLLNELKIVPSNLSAIAISEGPGSYTGLRIGLATAKGLAYTLNIPLIAVPTLQIMANAVLKKHDSPYLVPMIDARRMEVYLAVYNRKLELLLDVRPVIVDESFFDSYLCKDALVFGDGVLKCKEFIGATDFIISVVPSASFMVELSAKQFANSQFVDLAYFEPNYLKDFQAGKPRRMF